jgi:surface carbohydrate biosynthesis protein (TIGR04326 family)
VRLLVLGDYLPSNTQLQMKLLEQAVSFMAQPLEITVKPHPNCPIQPADYPGLRMRVNMEPIAKLLAECDVAYASAVTSAAVDAYCAGVPIVSVLDPDTLNLSPLRGCVGALFASTPEALASALASVANKARAGAHQPAYFTVDAKLPNWRRFLLEWESNP